MATAKSREHEILPVLTFNITENTINNAQRQLNCLKCKNKYEFPAQKDEYLGHLFLEHRLIIADVDDIALLADYLEYWQNEFKDFEFEMYCTTMLLDQLPDGRIAKNEKYFLLSDILPKDYELRHKLKQTSLERALAQHQFERTDRSFQKECLYCRDVITGLRSDYLEHLFHKHFLQLGKPENLVYIDELLAKVQQNLEQLICLYCEKSFKDRVTLKEHMRKKGHKRINESNREYDRFFLVNYRCEKTKHKHKRLHSSNKTKKTKQTTETTTSKHKNEEVTEEASIEHGTTTANVLRNKDDELLSEIAESSVDFESRCRRSEDSDSDWSDWNGEEVIAIRCLYCSHQETTFAELKTHMLELHSLDFDAAVEGLNFYQKIKIVNYVRRQICLIRCPNCDARCENVENLLEHMHNEKHCTLGNRKQWDKPEYFFPTYEDDGLLCVLDDSPTEEPDDAVVRIISEDSLAQINKDAERLSLENFNF